MKKIMQTLRSYDDPMEQSVYLAGLQDRNETLFYRALVENIEELAPIVYTPVVGQVCQRFGQAFRRPRGMFVSSKDRGSVAAMMYNWPHDDVQIVVITDGSRILGLGDLGANGMGIPIGKLSLYVAAGGIDPSKVLPVMLDCGTDNQELLEDPFYIGMQHPRLDGERYYALVDETVRAIFSRYPKALVQFEDFQTKHASHLLNSYRNDFLVFNDDIQGTGSVALASMMSALRMDGVASTKLSDQRVLVLGAGSAGLGVASTIMRGMEIEGLSRDEASNNFWLFDQEGLLGRGRSLETLTGGQRMFTRGDMDTGLSVAEVVRQVKPTMILGLTGVGGTFTEEIITEMAAHVHRPIIFPLSNPTANAECTAEQAFAWTEGRAIVASGSPFGPVEYEGRTMLASQCNNVFIFPGVGLGATLVQAKRVTDKMFYEAAVALSKCVGWGERRSGLVLPNIKDIREVTVQVAASVVRSAMSDGIARKVPDHPDIEGWVRQHMYSPQYRPLVSLSDL
jgi:malic enzyme